MNRVLHNSFTAPALRSSRKRSSNRVRSVQLHCCSLQSNLPEGDGEIDDGRVQARNHVILMERYGNGTTRRYTLDDDLTSQIFYEEYESVNDKLQDFHFSDTKLFWLPNIVKDFVLPSGFPDGYQKMALALLGAYSLVWPFYRHLKWGSDYMLNFTLAVAISPGGRFGNLFDDDPKQWRMYADFIGSAGSIFDLTTQLYPGYFLPLASLGNLAKAVARGLKDPSNRVIQNHFAISGNLGEIAAKEEVWEVTAQLLGLAVGILILDTPGLVKSYPAVLLTWMSTRLLHLWLRYQSLSVLRFNTINLKRARILVKSHVVRSTVPGSDDCNKQENILSWQRFMKPQIVFGVPLDELVGRERSISKVKTLLKLYANEKYILMVNQQQRDFGVFVSFKVGATSLSVLRSVWQTYWLQENFKSSDGIFDQLAESVTEMESRFEDFICQLDMAGWDTRNISLKVPNQISIHEIGPV